MYLYTNLIRTTKIFESLRPESSVPVSQLSSSSVYSIAVVKDGRTGPKDPNSKWLYLACEVPSNWRSRWKAQSQICLLLHSKYTTSHIPWEMHSGGCWWRSTLFVFVLSCGWPGSSMCRHSPKVEFCGYRWGIVLPLFVRLLLLEWLSSVTT